MKQHTLKHQIRATGIGVHTGETVQLALCPAPPDTGIVFRRVDLPGCPEILGHARWVTDTSFSTTLTTAHVRVSTVEHLLAAFSAMGVDNAYVEINAPEIPIMDGSAGVFVFLIQSAGMVAQEAPKRFVRIRKKITVQDGDRVASLEPYEGFAVQFSIVFDHPVFENGRQDKWINFSQQSFVKEISRARTFGFLSQYEMLQANQLARGANMENTIVFDEHRVVNESHLGGLRYKDEPVRHKILDTVGDLYLLGSPVIGLFRGFKSGHAMNNLLVQALLADPSAFDMVTFETGLTDREMFQLGLPVYAFA